jgi:hypothetical protein
VCNGWELGRVVRQIMALKQAFWSRRGVGRRFVWALRVSVAVVLRAPIMVMTAKCWMEAMCFATLIEPCCRVFELAWKIGENQ